MREKIYLFLLFIVYFIIVLPFAYCTLLYLKMSKGVFEYLYSMVNNKRLFNYCSLAIAFVIALILFIVTIIKNKNKKYTITNSKNCHVIIRKEVIQSIIAKYFSGKENVVLKKLKLKNKKNTIYSTMSLTFADETNINESIEKIQDDLTSQIETISGVSVRSLNILVCK